MKPLPSFSKKDFKYPYKWGEGIIQDFIERYPRATDFLCKMAEIDVKEFRFVMVKAICNGNQVRFEALKRLIKRCNEEVFESYKHLPLKERLLYLTYEKWNCEDEALDYLFWRNGP
jgi:hypothetical protein